VLVPNISGKTIREAESELNALSLKLGSIEYELNDEFAEGIIISNEGVGKSYNQGSEVAIVVSNGPTTDGTTTDGTTTGEGTTTGDGAVVTPPTESEISLALYASTFANDPELIRIDLVQGTSRTAVYEETHYKADGDFRIKVKGSGFATIEVYYSGVLVSQESVQF